MAAGTSGKLDPELALRPGTLDSKILLGLWVVRKTLFPLVWLGLAVPVIALGDLTELEDGVDFGSPADLFSTLLSPLGVLVAAFGIRFLVGWAALATAYPLTTWTSPDEYPSRYRWMNVFSSWRDRLFLARSYRSLRWSKVVRESAKERIGLSARIFSVSEVVVFWSGVVFMVAFFVIAVLTTGSADGT